LPKLAFFLVKLYLIFQFISPSAASLRTLNPLLFVQEMAARSVHKTDAVAEEQSSRMPNWEDEGERVAV